ncbi:hypothetical protein AB3N60_11415 [Leptospira sp. WS39.C2]
MQRIELKVITIISILIFFSCKKETTSSLKENANLNYEKVLLENSAVSLQNFFKQRFLIISFPNHKIKLGNSTVILDYSLNKNGSISKPFPTSPCGIDVEGSWKMKNNTIITEGHWSIPKSNCHKDILNNISHSSDKKSFAHKIYNFRFKKNNESEIIASLNMNSIVNVLIQE